MMQMQVEMSNEHVRSNSKSPRPQEAEKFVAQMVGVFYDGLFRWSWNE